MKTIPAGNCLKGNRSGKSTININRLTGRKIFYGWSKNSNLQSDLRKLSTGHWLSSLILCGPHQVPVIRLIGDAYGPITMAFIPMILSTLIFLPFCGWKIKNESENEMAVERY